MSDWILVSDGLPEIKRDVLVSLKKMALFCGGVVSVYGGTGISVDR